MSEWRAGCPGGVHGPEAYWQMLRDGVDAVSEVPADRWDVEAFFDPATRTRPARWSPGGAASSTASICFDAPCFDISPREAVTLDPQQRLLLEISWEALEDAGQPTDGLVDSPTGVFVGIGTGDYAQLLSQMRDFGGIDAYRATGCISRSPGLRPRRLRPRSAGTGGLDRHRLFVVARRVHLACQSLRDRRVPHGAGRWRQCDSLAGARASVCRRPA